MGFMYVPISAYEATDLWWILTLFKFHCVVIRELLFSFLDNRFNSAEQVDLPDWLAAPGECIPTAVHHLRGISIEQQTALPALSASDSKSCRLAFQYRTHGSVYISSQKSIVHGCVTFHDFGRSGEVQCLLFAAVCCESAL